MTIEDLLTRLLAVAIAVAGVVATYVDSAAQGRPKADVSVVVDADGVRAGSNARVALRVSLPDGVHVQSNQPRDPLLIASAVTPTLPAGVSLVETLFPPAVDFKQAAASEPLSVFEQTFVIGLKLAVAPSVAPGDVNVPIRFRYQACDERTCFAPLREDFSAVLHMLPEGVTPKPQFTDVFARLRFSR
ncbi:MAG: protein-disulfide reductase DsbD domain-containing protein [Vicinamibacterales bacterium]